MDLAGALFNYGLLAPLGIVLVFFVLVLIHELGHYAVGRAFGVGVEEFAIGFGPRLGSFTDAHGTRWAVRMLPLGGFVKFVGDQDASSRPLPTPDLDVQSPMDARKDALASLELWKRALIVAAGPAANLLLALGLLVLQFTLIGMQRLDPLVGAIEPDGVAAQAGLQPGDQIIEVAGAAVSSFAEVDRLLEAHLGQEIVLNVRRSDQEVALVFQPAPGFGELFGASASGFYPKIQLSVAEVEPGTPAAAMGLQVGDTILAYDGVPLTNPRAFEQARTAAIGTPMRLTLARGGQERVVEGAPVARLIEDENGDMQRIGVFGFTPTFNPPLQRLGVGPALGAATQTLSQFSLLVFRLPAQFINRQRSLDDLGGPMRIVETVGQVVLFAPTAILLMAGLLSLQLGLINLFPIPVLDGGHLLLYGAEAIWRRPLPQPLVIWLFRLGGAMLIAFFLAVTANDLVRSFDSWF